MVELEEQYGKDQKKKNQVAFKRDLDQCTREKLKRRAKEVQEDLVQDLFFLNQIAESAEEAERCEKKVRSNFLNNKVYVLTSMR